VISDTLYEAAKDIRTYLELMPDVYRIYADRLNALVDEMDRIRALPGMDGSPENSVARAYPMAATLTPTPAPNTAQPPCGSSSEQPDGPPQTP
jgi:hypothetical protein